MNVLNVNYYYHHYLYYTTYTIIISNGCLYNYAYTFVNYMLYANTVYNTEQKRTKNVTTPKGILVFRAVQTKTVFTYCDYENEEKFLEA